MWFHNLDCIMQDVPERQSLSVFSFWLHPLLSILPQQYSSIITSPPLSTEPKWTTYIYPVLSSIFLKHIHSLHRMKLHILCLSLHLLFLSYICVCLYIIYIICVYIIYMYEIKNQTNFKHFGHFYTNRIILYSIFIFCFHIMTMENPESTNIPVN